MIDRDKPDESKLLTAPIRPHGANRMAIFSDRQQSQYRQLVLWVYHVAGARRAAPPSTLEERSAPLLERGPRSGAAPDVDPPGAAAAKDAGLPSDASTPQTSASPPAPKASRDAASWSDTFPDQKGAVVPESADTVLAEGAEANGPGTTSSAIDRAAPGRGMASRSPSPRGFVPKDAFDPEIFNRRFHGP